MVLRSFPKGSTISIGFLLGRVYVLASYLSNLIEDLSKENDRHHVSIQLTS